MKTVLKFIRPHKWLFILGLILMLVELAVELIQPIFISEIIDNGILKNDLNPRIFIFNDYACNRISSPFIRNME